VKRDVVFFDESGGGVTLSGGEPLFQPSFAAAFLAQCQARRIHTALDTCGFAPWEDLKRVAQHADLILYDLKILSDSRHRRWTGHSNALILDNLTRLDALGKPVWIRIPFILEMHDDPDELSRLGAFIANLNCVEAVHLLPYHRTGEAKRQQLERSGTPKLDVPDERAVAAAGERLTRAAGQAVVIGG
jgi:pyruvate formate lyase activating enzyme